VRLAREIMQKEIVAVRPDTEVSELLRVLDRARISGAPVLEEDGTVVGVVSTTDVVRLAARAMEEAGGDTGQDPAFTPPEESDEESGFFLATGQAVVLSGGSMPSLPAGVFDGYTVEDIMTEAAFTVSPSATAREVADFLLRGRIHRALVVEKGILRGLITTFDLLRVLVEGDGAVGD